MVRTLKRLDLELKKHINPPLDHTKQHYKTKIIKAGELIRVYQYNVPIYCDRNTYRVDYTKNPLDRSSKSLRRTRDSIRNLIEVNKTQYYKLITLTTKKPIEDRLTFNKYLTYFRRQFKKIFGVDSIYLGVYEGQEKRKETYKLDFAPLHVHLVIFIDKFLPFKDLKKCWPYGSVDVKHLTPTKTNPNGDIARYFMKYITKQTLEVNKKGYLRTRNLKQPKTVLLDTDIDISNLTPTYDDIYTFSTRPDKMSNTKYFR